MKSAILNLAGLILLLVTANIIKAQEIEKVGIYTRGGYISARLNYRPANIEYLVNQFNNIPGVTNPLELPKRLDGIMLGASIVQYYEGGLRASYDFDFYNRSAKTNSASYIDTKTNEQKDVKMKVRINTITWAGVSMGYKKLCAGFSFLDCTITTISKKGSDIETGRISDWAAVYEKKKHLNWGSTYYAGLYLPFNGYGSFEIRGIYQHFWFPSKHGMPFIGNNFAISATIAFGTPFGN